MAISMTAAGVAVVRYDEGSPVGDLALVTTLSMNAPPGMCALHDRICSQAGYATERQILVRKLSHDSCQLRAVDSAAMSLQARYKVPVGIGGCFVVATPASFRNV